MEQDNIIKLYPQDLTQLTLDDELEIVKYLCQSCNLQQLRKRQELTEIQLKAAYKQRNEKAIKNLRIMEKHLQMAVLMKG